MHGKVDPSRGVRMKAVRKAKGDILQLTAGHSRESLPAPNTKANDAYAQKV